MKKKFKDKGMKCGATGSGGCIWFLGFVGSVIYYLSTATGFWSAVLGILKSVVWPVFLVHGLFRFMGL